MLGSVVVGIYIVKVVLVFEFVFIIFFLVLGIFGVVLIFKCKLKFFKFIEKELEKVF